MKIESWSCDVCRLPVDDEPPHVSIERRGLAIDGMSATRSFDVCLPCLERLGFAKDGQLVDHPRCEPLLTAAEREHMQQWTAQRATTRG